jgi:hypothetical protein
MFEVAFSNLNQHMSLKDALKTVQKARSMLLHENPSAHGTDTQQSHKGLQEPCREQALLVCIISGFCCSVKEIFALLGCYAVQTGR